MEVVARPNASVEIGGGVSDGEDHEPEGAVDRGGLPHRAAAHFPGVGIAGAVRPLPGQIAVQRDAKRIGLAPFAPPPTLLGAGNGIEAPDLRAGCRVVGGHPTPDAVLAATHADDHLAVGRNRCCVHRIAPLVVGYPHVPGFGAGSGVERHEASVEGPHIDPASVNGDPAVHRPATVDRGPQALGMLPELAASLRIERDNVIEGRGDIHDVVDDDRAGFKRLANAGRVVPGRLQILDAGGRDLGKRGIPLVAMVAAVGGPTRGVGHGSPQRGIGVGRMLGRVDPTGDQPNGQKWDRAGTGHESTIVGRPYTGLHLMFRHPRAVIPLTGRRIEEHAAMISG